MHKPNVSQLVYNAIYPKPRSNDPGSFGAHITRNLVAEVRVETSNFYGSLDCIEAQYPGLDYSFPPHRKRLSRYHHHRRLFRAFDELGLSPVEISTLCRWEGTKSARERYERDEGVTIRDTTADRMIPIAEHTPPSVLVHIWEDENHHSIAEKGRTETANPDRTSAELPDHEADLESSDDGIESYGTRLNERLLEVTAARERGGYMSNDELELFEEWLKEAVTEHDGGYSDMMDAIREGRPIDLNRDTPAFSRASGVANPTNNAQGEASLSVAAQHSSASVPRNALVPGLGRIPPPEPYIGSQPDPAARTAR